MKLFIYDKDTNYYPISQGLVLGDTYNEELDSATIIVPQLNGELNIEPYDVVGIFDDSYNLITKLIVEDITCTETCLSPKVYQYDITLMSKTKELEGIVLPNLKITRNEDNPKKIKYYLENYVAEYSPKIYNNGYSQKYTLSTRTINKFNSVDCPEMQWNEPTLREVLTDLMMVEDCIPILINNEIDYTDISLIKGTANADQLSKINYTQISMSAGDYVSDVKMKLVNGMDDVNTLKKERFGFRNSECYILTTENIRLETRYPIWKLKSLLLRGKIASTIQIKCSNPGENPFTYVVPIGTEVVMDLTDYTLEFQEWQIQDIYYGAFSQMPLNPHYQNTCLFFTRGVNLIRNFENKQDYTNPFFIGSQVSVWELILQNWSDVQGQLLELAEEQNPGYTTYEFADFDFKLSASDFENSGNFNYFNFDIEYYTLDEPVFNVSKAGHRNHRTIVDNQTNPFVNIDRQGILEYFKANRLGNKLKLSNARYNSWEDYQDYKIDLGYKIDDSVVFKRELSIYNNYVIANYYSTENYVLRDYYTGIKSKIRSWKVLDEKDACLRADLFKFYVNTEIESVDDGTYKIPVYYTLDGYLQDFNYCVMTFEDANQNIIPSGTISVNNSAISIDAFLMEFTEHRCGDSVIFTIKLKDNTMVDKYINNTSGLGGTYQKNARYTDDNGEFVGGVIYFYKKMTSLNSSLYNLEKPYIKVSSMFDSNDLVFKYPFTMHKDNGEITQITIQFEFNENADDIFIGNR